MLEAALFAFGCAFLHCHSPMDIHLIRKGTICNRITSNVTLLTMIAQAMLDLHVAPQFCPFGAGMGVSFDELVWDRA